jgi:hypothetical protein
VEKNHIPIEVLDSNGILLTAAVAVFSRSNVPSVGWVGALTPKGPTAKGPDAHTFNRLFLQMQGDVNIRFADGRTVGAVKVHTITRGRVTVRVSERYSATMESVAKRYVFTYPRRG